MNSMKANLAKLPICLYMFTTVNNNKYKNIGTLDTIHVRTVRPTARYSFVVILDLILRCGCTVNVL